jgi:hypothetical protein
VESKHSNKNLTSFYKEKKSIKPEHVERLKEEEDAK